MNFNIDESKIVKIVIDGDKDNFIGFDIKDGKITETTIIPKKAPKVYTPGASVLDKEIDRDLINKSHEIAAKIAQLRGDSNKEKSISDEIMDAINEAKKNEKKAFEHINTKEDDLVKKWADNGKKIIDTLESDNFKKSGVSFADNGRTATMMEELKEEAERDFKETWNNSCKESCESDPDWKIVGKKESKECGGFLTIKEYKPNDEKVKTPSFQEGVTEKEQQILDIVSETPIDKLAENEELLKKIGEYKNLMKSKMTKFEAAKNKHVKPIFNGGLIDTDGNYGERGKVYPRQ